MTHQQIANRFRVSVVVVAIIREVGTGTSAHSRRALEETRIDHLAAAAVWLAKFRGCHTASEEITRELVKEVCRYDGQVG